MDISKHRSFCVGLVCIGVFICPAEVFGSSPKEQAEAGYVSTETPVEKSKETADKFIYFEEIEEVNAFGEPVDKDIVPYQGKYGIELSPPEFYRTVGRPDLAETYEWRETRLSLGAGLMIPSTIASIRGFLGFIAEANVPLSSGLLGGGFAGVVGSLILLPLDGFHPVSKERRRRLAHRYNQKLRRESNESSPAAQSSNQGLDPRVGVTVSPDTALAALSIRF